MVVELVGEQDVKTKKGKTKGEKYAKYAQSIAKNISWIKQQVNESPDGKIRLKIGDVKSDMGQAFEKLSDKAVYWGLRFVLFHEGLVVETGLHKDGDRLLMIRMGTPNDKLPHSLSVVIEPPEEEMPEPGIEE